jgi:hypothetical protein
VCASASNDGPLCFVVTRNHGSLIDAMLFLHGTALLERSVLLLPPELTSTHQPSLKIKTHGYNSFDELLHWIEVERPSVLFFFSGYLLTSQRLLTARQLKRLLRILEERGCEVLTNDPCWGLLASRLRMTSELPSRTYIQKLRKAWIEWLIPHRLRQSYPILKHLLHLYPVSVGRTLSADGLRTVEYFNTNVLSASTDYDEHARTHPNGEPSLGDHPHWLFILASVDYSIQVTLHGKAEFVDTLAAKLREANQADRRAILIAPEECLAAVKRRPELRDATLIGFCDYERYVSLLLGAEYVFYWNIGSSSNLYRLFNGLPVFYFDRGHVSRWFPSFYERTVELVYRGHAPTILDQREPLCPSRLKSLANTYQSASAEILRHLEPLPGPEELVARLLRPAKAATAAS